MRGLMPMAVVIVCLNAFFFVMLWGTGVSIQVPVLLCPFSPHMIFLFVCVVLFSMHGNELMPILVAWLVVLPVYVALYCLVRYVR